MKHKNILRISQGQIQVINATFGFSKSAGKIY